MSEHPWRTRNLKVLTAVSFTQDAASELLYPILPLFLTATLGAPPVAVGAIEGAANGASALMKMVSGRLSDRIARKPLIFIGYGAAAVGKFLVAIALVWPVVLLGRIVDRIGKGVRSTPRDALLVEGVDRQYRGRTIGFHRTGDTLGAVFGPILGLGAIELFDRDLRLALWVALIPAVLSVLLVALARDPRPKIEKHSSTFHRVPLPKRLLSLITTLTIFGLINFPDALLLLRAYDLGLSATTVIAIYIVYNLSYSLLAYPVGALSDRLPRHLVYAVGLFAFAGAYIGLAYVSETWQVFALFFVYGAFAACDDAGGKSWVSFLAPNRAQGWAQGLFQGLTGAATLIAGLWAGLLWGMGPGEGRVPLLISGFSAIAVALVVVIFGSRWIAAPEHD